MTRVLIGLIIGFLVGWITCITYFVLREDYRNRRYRK